MIGAGPDTHFGCHLLSRYTSVPLNANLGVQEAASRRALLSASMISLPHMYRRICRVAQADCAASSSFSLNSLLPSLLARTSANTTNVNLCKKDFFCVCVCMTPQGHCICDVNKVMELDGAEITRSCVLGVIITQKEVFLPRHG